MSGTTKLPMLCPYCGHKTTISAIKYTGNFWIGTCDNPSCEKELVAKVRNTGEAYIEGKHLPTFTLLETIPKYIPTLHSSIPETVGDDFLEAVQCYQNCSNKATVVMCRRAMQNMCLDKGAKKKYSDGKWIPLKEQISSAFPGAYFEYLRVLAEEIKYLGDYGAHPQDDGIDKVTEEDAKQLLDFTENMMDTVYVQPYKVKELSKKRK